MMTCKNGRSQPRFDWPWHWPWTKLGRRVIGEVTIVLLIAGFWLLLWLLSPIK